MLLLIDANAPPPPSSSSLYFNPFSQHMLPSCKVCWARCGPPLTAVQYRRINISSSSSSTPPPPVVESATSWQAEAGDLKQRQQASPPQDGWIRKPAVPPPPPFFIIIILKHILYFEESGCKHRSPPSWSGYKVSKTQTKKQVWGVK